MCESKSVIVAFITFNLLLKACSAMVISLSLLPSMTLKTFQFYQTRFYEEDTQMFYAIKNIKNLCIKLVLSFFVRVTLD